MAEFDSLSQCNTRFTYNCCMHGKQHHESMVVITEALPCQAQCGVCFVRCRPRVTDQLLRAFVYVCPGVQWEMATGLRAFSGEALRLWACPLGMPAGWEEGFKEPSLQC